MVNCPHCAAPLRSPNAKFCTSCGKSVVPSAPAVQTIAEPLPQLTRPVTAPTANEVSKVTTTLRPIPIPVVAPVVSTNTLAAETEEVASWKFNFGAFLVPGVWLLAHRIRPKIVPLVLLGIPMAILSITTITSIFAARAAEQASASGATNSIIGNTPYDFWNSAVYPIGFLLSLYILACLSSIKSARGASLDAWRNFPEQRLPAFRSAQRLWGVGGLLLCCLLIGTNAYVWTRYNFWQEKEFQNFTSPKQSSSLMPRIISTQKSTLTGQIHAYYVANGTDPNSVLARVIGLKDAVVNHKTAGEK